MLTAIVARGRVLPALLVVLGACHKPDEQAGATEPPVNVEAPNKSTPLDAQFARLPAVAWWNSDESIATLKLTLEQRQKMDAFFERYLHDTASLREADGSLRGTFFDALVKGTRQDAVNAAQKLQTEPLRGLVLDMQLKIDVLFVMSDEQRKRMGDLYPGLVRKPWVRRWSGNRPQGIRGKRKLNVKARGRRQGEQ